MSNTPAVRDRDRGRAEVQTFEPRDPTEPLDPIEPQTIYPVDPNIILDEEGGSVAYAYGRGVNEEDDESESRRQSRRSSRSE
jgi:hypothetical protein